LANKDSLYFLHNNQYIKLANIESPTFIGTPTVPTPMRASSKNITNVEFVKAYIESKLYNLGYHIISAVDYELELYPNKEYMINVCGVIDIPEDTTTNITLGYVAITNNSNTVIAKTGSVSSTYTSTGGIKQSATLIVRTPMNGIVRGYLNYGGTKGKINATYMCAVEVDRDEQCNIYLNQKEHETMYLTANGKTISDAEFMLSKNSVYKINVVCDIGYKNGIVTPSTSGVINGNTTFNIGDATYSPCNVIISQSANQTIYVNTENVDHITNFIGRYNTPFTVRVVPVSDTYIAGTPSISSGNFTGNITITATPAEVIYRTLTITQKAHQTITLTRLDTGEKSTTNIRVPHNTSMLAEIKAESGYKKGTLNVNRNFNATTNMTITATDAQPI